MRFRQAHRSWATSRTLNTQLRQAAIRNALCGGIRLAADPGDGCGNDDDDVNDADLVIPLGDAPVPARSGQPCPPRIAPVRLSAAETARLTAWPPRRPPG
jgi:hypothetical protein